MLMKAADRFASSLRSLDQLVGAEQEWLRDRQAKRLGCGQIDDEIELGRLLDWKLARLGAAQNLVNIISGAPEQVSGVRSVRHQTSRFDVLPQACDRR